MFGNHRIIQLIQNPCRAIPTVGTKDGLNMVIVKIVIQLCRSFFISAGKIPILPYRCLHDMISPRPEQLYRRLSAGLAGDMTAIVSPGRSTFPLFLLAPSAQQLAYPTIHQHKHIPITYFHFCTLQSLLSYCSQYVYVCQPTKLLRFVDSVWLTVIFPIKKEMKFIFHAYHYSHLFLQHVNHYVFSSFFLQTMLK